MDLASIYYGIDIITRVLILEEFNVAHLIINKNYQKRDIFIATMKNRPLLPTEQKFNCFLIEHILIKYNDNAILVELGKLSYYLMCQKY